MEIDYGTRSLLLTLCRGKSAFQGGKNEFPGGKNDVEICYPAHLPHHELEIEH